MVTLISLLFGKKVELGSRIEVKTHVFGKPLHEGDYYKLSGYQGTFKLEREQDFNHSAHMLATFVREDVSKDYTEKVSKLHYVPKDLTNMH